VLALTQPVIGGAYAPAAFALLLVILSVAFWRGAADLHEHVQAGAQMIVEALITQARTGSAPGQAQRAPTETGLEMVHKLLPGLGEPTAVKLDERSPAIGKSLAELNLRGVTGATVLAMTRGETGLHVPSAKEPLQVGDVLTLAGSHDAIDRAMALLVHVEREEPQS